MIYISTFLISFVLALLLLPLTIKIGEKFYIFSKPKGGKIKGKPCLGGIGIFVAFMVAMGVALLFKITYDIKFTGLIISSTLIVFLGLIDDAKDLKPFIKIVVELIAIVFLVGFGIFTKIFFLPHWLNILGTFLWILFIINAFNLLDIVDGLASGLVIIVSLTLLIISLVKEDIFSSLVLTALIGAHLGFLRFNYPPAKLFMGDTGSLFSGLILALVSINISYAPFERPVALITPILAMSLPIYDTLFLIVMRIKRRKPVFSKSKDHFALRLVTMGYSERKSLWIMYFFSIFLAIASIVVAFGPNILGATVISIIIAAFILMGKRVGMVRIEES